MSAALTLPLSARPRAVEGLVAIGMDQGEAERFVENLERRGIVGFAVLRMLTHRGDLEGAACSRWQITHYPEDAAAKSRFGWGRR